mgnify:CR=1 FL=1
MSTWQASAAIAAVAALSAVSPVRAEEQCHMIYRADEINLTGLRHLLGGASPINETVRYEGFYLLVENEKSTATYRTIGGGTAVQERLAIRDDGEKDEELRFMFYDLHGHNIPGTPDHFLLLAGDLYWPEGAATGLLPFEFVGKWESDPANCKIDRPEGGTSIEMRSESFSFTDYAAEGGDCLVVDVKGSGHDYTMTVRCKAEESGYGDRTKMGARTDEAGKLLWLEEAGDEDTYFRCD